MNGRRSRWTAALLAGACALAVAPSLAGDAVYYYRAKPALVGDAGPGSPAEENLSISLQAPSPFALTIGESVSVPLSVDGPVTDVTYQASALAFMPGLSVNPSTGAVTGTPSGETGTSYVIAVEAVRNGKSAAVSPPVERFLRSALEVVTAPDDIALSAGETFPSTGIGAQAAGGNLEGLSWSLENAPTWLEIVDGAEPGHAVLRVKDGIAVPETSRRAVTVVVADDEGREDRSRSFVLSVMPPAAKLLASEGAPSDNFGNSVSLSADGRTALVGAASDDNPVTVTDSGSSWVFSKGGGSWTPSELVAPGTITNSRFGFSTSLSADGLTAVITEYGQGKVRVFDRSGSSWTERTPPLVSPEGRQIGFGYSAAVSDDGSTVLIGDVSDSSLTGAAWAFDWEGSSWKPGTKILAPVSAAGDRFGFRVSLGPDGETAMIGAVGDSNLAGAAWVFDRNGESWVPRPKLTASTRGSGDRFGWSVAISSDGSTALAGAYGDDDNGTDSGSAWAFHWDGASWSRHAIFAPDGVAGDEFGKALALSSDGSIALIAAPKDDDKGGDAGAAWAFGWNGTAWSARSKILAFDGAAGDNFGDSVSLSADGSVALVGAPNDDDNGANSGSAYFIPVP